MMEVTRDQLMQVLDILEYLKDFSSTVINTQEDNRGLYEELLAVAEG